jgi:hypothetical protein
LDEFVSTSYYCISFFTVNFLVMTFVLVNTYRNSKFVYLYATASTFLVASFFGICLGVFIYWTGLCNPAYKLTRNYSDKCPDIGNIRNLDYSFINAMKKAS